MGQAGVGGPPPTRRSTVEADDAAPGHAAPGHALEEHCLRRGRSRGDSRASGGGGSDGLCCRVGDRDETKRTVLTRVYCCFMFSNKSLTSEQPADPRVASYALRSASLGEAAARRPPRAGSSPARFGGPRITPGGRPRSPPALRERRPGLLGPLDEGEPNFVLITRES